VRLRDALRFEPDQQATECLVEIGTRRSHPWDERREWTGELEVVARYCYRDGTTSEGGCAAIP
jgi:hypothetical protein